jgi:hypothetical protein
VNVSSSPDARVNVAPVQSLITIMLKVMVFV